MDKGCFSVPARFRSVLPATLRVDVSLVLIGEEVWGRMLANSSVLQILELLSLRLADDASLRSVFPEFSPIDRACINSSPISEPQRHIYLARTTLAPSLSTLPSISSPRHQGSGRARVRCSGIGGPWVRQVLQSGGKTKQVAFMWKLAFLCGAPDLQALPALCVGTRMLDLTLPIEGMPSIVWEPQSTIAEYRADRLQWNAKVDAQAKRVTDKAFMAKTWDKSSAEAQRGVVLGPFRVLAQVPVQTPSLCWRKAVWESRNGEQEVRVIDDMLVSGQILTAGEGGQHAVLKEKLCGPSAKAKKQVPRRTPWS